MEPDPGENDDYTIKIVKQKDAVRKMKDSVYILKN